MSVCPEKGLILISVLSVLLFTTTTKVDSARMSGLSKGAPFDVRFALHYNYKSRIFCNNGGLVKTGTI